MDSILAYTPEQATLYRHRVTTLPFQPPPSVFYDPTRLITHLQTDHPALTIHPSSTSISDSILAGQLARGFTSDGVKGGFMASFNPSTPIKTLTYPTIGAAWNYFENKITSFYIVTTTIPLRNLSPNGGHFVVVGYNASFPNTSLTPFPNLLFGKPNQKYRIVQPTQFNTGSVLTAPGLINQNFTQPQPNIYEAEVKEVPNNGVANIQINPSLFSTVREYTLTGDLFPAGTSGFFNETEFAAIPLVQTINEHIQTYPHHGVRDDLLSDVTCLSATLLYQRFLNNAGSSALQQGHGGDAWLQSDGTNNAHPVEPVTAGTQIYWIAIYNGDVPGKRVRHPDGSILAAPVNGKKRIRCAFILPSEITPIADSGVILRRCNPTWGYKLGLL